MMNALEVENLVKNYDSFEALKGINLTIRSGEFFGLLGPNGAGKTTLIKTIVNLAKPTQGKIRLFGHDNQQQAVACRSMIGLSPQESNVDRFFSVKRILYFHAGYYGMARPLIRKRIDIVLAQCGLSDKKNVAFWRLSGGMQRRVMIARSLMTNPALLILDEPTAGVDVEQRHQLWELLRTLNRDGTTIILTTHYIDEAEELCERVAIIHGGRIVESGEPHALIRKHCKQRIQIRGLSFEQLGSTELAQLASAAAILPDEVISSPGNLEEVFIKLTGQSIHEDEHVEAIKQ